MYTLLENNGQIIQYKVPFKIIKVNFRPFSILPFSILNFFIIQNKFLATDPYFTHVSGISSFPHLYILPQHINTGKQIHIYLNTHICCKEHSIFCYSMFWKDFQKFYTYKSQCQPIVSFQIHTVKPKLLQLNNGIPAQSAWFQYRSLSPVQAWVSHLLNDEAAGLVFPQFPMHYYWSVLQPLSFSKAAFLTAFLPPQRVYGHHWHCKGSHSPPIPHRALTFILVGPSGVKTFSYPWPDVSLLRVGSSMAARGLPAACWIDSGKVFEWELVNLRMLQLLFEASAGKCFLSAGTNLCCQPYSPSWLSIQCCTHLVPGALCTYCSVEIGSSVSSVEQFFWDLKPRQTTQEFNPDYYCLSCDCSLAFEIGIKWEKVSQQLISGIWFTLWPCHPSLLFPELRKSRESAGPENLLLARSPHPRQLYARAAAPRVNSSKMGTSRHHPHLSLPK